MSDSTDLGEWEFVGRRGAEATRLVPGEVIAAIPAAKAFAERSGNELRFDFLDDRGVLHMLRLRHEDEVALFNAGFKIGVPLALVGFGTAVYWGGAVQFWESGTARLVYAAAACAVVLLLLAVFFRTAALHWGNPVRQNLRARARAYRELAHLARKGGADVPAHYPHYGSYPFAATFRPEVDEAETVDEEGLS
ncbi:hypothetical protein [Streptomyces sp. Ag109_O5-10]|uniref:hypothetical protein n=1 Tax=Streptomyces sp. Ag109_O5-10 TaxID=1855349 RepID=UPI0008946F4F|nr:hypothetical protein [Streptomyces sp. Ag109_O5-10]SEE77412.1 hypothetical protein SAMN05216533_3634 [Streptomyces sp. Ag109_O5-10]